MITLHQVAEGACLGVMAAWLLGCVLYSLPVRRLRRRLERFNFAVWFTDWNVFGTVRQRAGDALYTLRFRDGAGPWVEVIHGRRWTWHSFLFQPSRRLDDRLQRLGRRFSGFFNTPAGAARVAMLQRAALARYIESVRRREPGATREVQMIEHRSVLEPDATCDDADEFVEDRVILAFTLSKEEPHG